MYCKRCNNKLSENSKYCVNCGVELNEKTIMHIRQTEDGLKEHVIERRPMLYGHSRSNITAFIGVIISFVSTFIPFYSINDNGFIIYQTFLETRVIITVLLLALAGVLVLIRKVDLAIIPLILIIGVLVYFFTGSRVLILSDNGSFEIGSYAMCVGLLLSIGSILLKDGEFNYLITKEARWIIPMFILCVIVCFLFGYFLPLDLSEFMPLV